MSRRTRRPRRARPESGADANAGDAPASVVRPAGPRRSKVLLIAAATVLALWVSFLLVLAVAK